MASTEAIEAAVAAKTAANNLYAENKLDEAIAAYTTALQQLPELDGSDEDLVAALVGSQEAGLRAVLLTNRAQCYLMQAPCLFPPRCFTIPHS
jgi:histidinol-phosphate/aromatic aminotransferase/cobyric acid decarboxylase-like protein